MTQENEGYSSTIPAQILGSWNNRGSLDNFKNCKENFWLRELQVWGNTPEESFNCGDNIFIANKFQLTEEPCSQQMLLNENDKKHEINYNVKY